MGKTVRKKVVPIKNVMNVLIDVKRPDFDYVNLRRFSKLNLSQTLQYKRNRTRNVFRFMTMLVGAVFVLGGTFVFINARGAKGFLAKRSEKIAGNFSSSIDSLKDFKLSEASRFFREN